MVAAPSLPLYPLTLCFLHWNDGNQVRQEVIQEFRSAFQSLDYNQKVAFVKSVASEHHDFLAAVANGAYSLENLRLIIPGYDGWLSADNQGTEQLLLVA